MLSMKKYVGRAKILPDSLTPRRLPRAMSAMKNSAIGTRYGSSAWNAEVRAAVPAEADTATVRM